MLMAGFTKTWTRPRGTGQSGKLRQLGVAKEKDITEVLEIDGRRLLGGLGGKQSKAEMHAGMTNFLHDQHSHWDLRKADQ